VPAGSIEIYKEADVWKEFINIEAIESEITLNYSEIFLLTGKSALLTATVTDDVFSSDIVVWSSSHPTVAQVDETGELTALVPGSTVITASTFESDATCMVTVIQSGKSSIEGNVTNAGIEKVFVNLYMKPTEDGTKKSKVVGGYVLLASTIPNEDGQYSFDDLPEGVYQVEIVIDDYEPEATSEISLSENKNLTDIDFILDVDEGKIIVKDVTTGTNEIPDAGIKIYPNPFTDVLRITGEVEMWRAASLLYQTRHATSLHIINVAGTIVHTQMMTNPDETIQLGHLPAGMYILRLENGERTKTVKIIKN